MFAKFLSLDEEKQDRIINAAITEFAKKGYGKASTNEIVKEANISKGLLFHYFKSKKDLFLFLYDYFTELLTKEFYEKFDLTEKDIFTRLKNLMVIKMQLINKHPEIMNFMIAANYEESAEIRAELENRKNEMLTSSYQKIFDNIDVSKFKEGIDIKRAMSTIIWTFEGFRNQEVEKAKLAGDSQNDFTEAFAEIDFYIELLRKSFYK